MSKFSEAYVTYGCGQGCGVLIFGGTPDSRVLKYWDTDSCVIVIMY